MLSYLPQAIPMPLTNTAAVPTISAVSVSSAIESSSAFSDLLISPLSYHPFAGIIIDNTYSY